jgi:hypothetical protein
VIADAARRRRIDCEVPKTEFVYPRLGQEETKMDSDYVFLCGLMWCRFGQQEAGRELLRAAGSADPDIEALARAMFAKGLRRLREPEERTHSSFRTTPNAMPLAARK